MDMRQAFRALLGIELTDVRPAVDGQGRTCFARWAGREVIAKWGRDDDIEEKLPYVAGQVAQLLARGVRVPEFLAQGRLPDGAWAWVLERLPGTPAQVIDPVLLDDLTTLLLRMLDAPPGQHRSRLDEWVPAVVFDDIAEWWRNAEAAGPDARAVCRRLRAWLRGVEAPTTRQDYVHCDLNLSNLVVANGRLAGVVDIENLGVGDRAVDAARLAFEWLRLARDGVRGLAPDGLERLTEAGRTPSGEAGWRIAVAYEVLGRLGWRSRHVTYMPDSALVATCDAFLDAVG
jgi:phosphotransferase family enzyme